MYLHQKIIRIYADIIQNHTLPGVFPNFWRAVYIYIYIYIYIQYIYIYYSFKGGLLGPLCVMPHKIPFQGSLIKEQHLFEIDIFVSLEMSLIYWMSPCWIKVLCFCRCHGISVGSLLYEWRSWEPIGRRGRFASFHPHGQGPLAHRLWRVPSWWHL